MIWNDKKPPMPLQPSSRKIIDIVSHIYAENILTHGRNMSEGQAN